MPVDVYPTIEDRFWSKVDMVNGPHVAHMMTRCWVWTGHIHQSGYGSIRIAGKSIPAHRYALMSMLGPDFPPELFALHHCDTRECVRPDHLYVGTKKQNALDREARGRGRWSRRAA